MAKEIQEAGIGVDPDKRTVTTGIMAETIPSGKNRSELMSAVLERGQLHRDTQQAARMRAGTDVHMEVRTAGAMGEKAASCLKHTATGPRQP